MTLSDKEIALELTKITVEHFNIRVAQKYPKIWINRGNH